MLNSMLKNQLKIAKYRKRSFVSGKEKFIIELHLFDQISGFDSLETF